ncbi:hypothetical protein G7Y89_g7033 [Cudoniella acicularis]|uniref:NACHT domain-containing protein n=1 Tax=Cudoniella acicularis TaxID=354080 RepID=A0A8H4W2B3_9HELO|nr:hypothetical protein G7Y89_g7033 [Cudoniella acicularis]
MDGLSAAASVIAVVQISTQIFELCQEYYSEVKDARKDIQRLRNEVTSLQDVLTNVEDLAEDSGSANLSVLNLLNQQDGPLRQCQKDLVGLVAKLELGQGKNTMKRFGMRALKWPFSSKDVEKLLITIGRHKATFNLALSADHIGLARAIKDDVARLNNSIAELQVGQKEFLVDERRQKIHQWLSPLDPSSNHNAACKKRQPTTGAWFVGSDQYEKWKTTSNSFLWLHGIPGCGKTILCSTIVQDVIRQYQSEPEFAVAYFYFDFNDSEKQRHDNFIRSLIVQLSTQSEKTPESLEALFTGSRQQPTTDALTSTLQQIIGDFQQTFILIDALDECNQREELLELMETIVGWKSEKVHILATSRREREIEEALQPLITDQILEIEETLRDGAHGMFRWVVCQLDSLKKCLKLDALRRALNSLPKTLDDTYARILRSIDEEYSQDAFRILQWLAYSARPLRIEEVAEVVAVKIVEKAIPVTCSGVATRRILRKRL